MTLPVDVEMDSLTISSKPPRTGVPPLNPFRTILVAVLLAALAGCGSPTPTFLGSIADGPPGTPEPARSTTRPATSSKPPAKPSKFRVVLDMAVSVAEDGTVTIHAESNLPDGTELGGDVFQEGGFMAQDSQVLHGGVADFGPFSDKGGPIPAGTYDVSVTMPIAANQPDVVKAVIGEHGEYLTGPQVKQAYGSATVHADKKLIVK